MDQFRLTISNAPPEAFMHSGDGSIVEPPKYVSRPIEPERTFISPYTDPKSYLALNPYNSDKNQIPQQAYHYDHNQRPSQTAGGDGTVPKHNSEKFHSSQRRLSADNSDSTRSSNSLAENYHIAETTIKSEHIEPLSTNKIFLNGVMDASVGSQRSKRPRSMSTSTSTKKNKSETIYDDAERLLEDDKSPLYKDNTNLKEVLQHPKAKSALASSSEGNKLEHVDSDTFASAAAAFKEDGQGGRHDQEWLRQAQAASEMRRNGGFRDYNEAQFMKHWAERSPELSGNEDDVRKDKKTGCYRVNNEKTQHRRDEFDDDDDDNVPASGSGGNTSYYGRSHSTSSKLSSNIKGDGKGNGKGKGNGSRPSYVTTNQLNHPFSSGDGGSNKLHGVTSESKIHSNTLTYDHLNHPFSRSDSNSMYPKYPSTKYHKYYAWDVAQVDDSDWPDRGYCDNPKSVYPEPSHGDHDGFKRLPDPVLPTKDDYSSMIGTVLPVKEADESREPSAKRFRGRPRGSGTRHSPSKAWI